MKPIQSLPPAVLLAGLLLSASCGEDDDDSSGGEATCQVGTLDCPCVDEHCNAGLICEESVCVEKVEEAQGGAGGVRDVGSDPDEEPQPTQSSIEVSHPAPGTLCAQGVVVGPESDDGWGSHWGAGLGINFCQASSQADKVAIADCATDLSRLQGFRLTVTGELPSELRVQFEDDFEGTDEVPGDNGYILAEVLDEPAEYLFEDAAVLYMAEASRPELDPGRFLSVQFQVASHMGETEDFDFCLENIEVVLSEEETAGDEAGDDDAASDDPACEGGAESLQLIPNDAGWVASCTNAAGLQGDMYRYSDGG